MYELQCIKCQDKYKTEDPDPYLCSPCNKTRVEIAKEIDKKMASMPPRLPRKSALQEFDAIAKMNGSGIHVRASDLGL